MRKLSTRPALDMSASQRQLATELGIQDAQELSPSGLIAAIEQHLGDQAALECARWFLMSLLRHELNLHWDAPDQSGLTREQQYDLAKSCLAIPEFVQSIKTVLKGDTCKFVLVNFHRTRNTAKQILANTTVAHHCALSVLRDAHLLAPAVRTDAAVVTQEENQDGISADVTTASLRRASRRGFASEVVRQDNKIPGTAGAMATTANTAPGTAAGTTLSPQEYAELEHALTQQPIDNSAPQIPRNFVDDESRSWLLGLLAGFAACAVILLVFF